MYLMGFMASLEACSALSSRSQFRHSWRRVQTRFCRRRNYVFRAAHVSKRWGRPLTNVRGSVLPRLRRIVTGTETGGNETPAFRLGRTSADSTGVGSLWRFLPSP
jgi:hypothetical protein